MPVQHAISPAIATFPLLEPNVESPDKFRDEGLELGYTVVIYSYSPRLCAGRMTEIAFLFAASVSVAAIVERITYYRIAGLLYALSRAISDWLSTVTER